MRLARLLVLVELGAWLAAPLAAQGVPRTSRYMKVIPRVMVANPFVFAAADSAAAVQIGSGIRDEMMRIVGDDYVIVQQEQMNDALNQYGYPTDAILNPTLAITLAKNIQARTIITSTLARAPGSHYIVTARLVGVDDHAGNVVEVPQRPNEKFSDFGQRIARALEPVIKSLSDAKACVEEQETKPDKAARSAEKALKKVPNHGLAQLCLAQIAARADSAGPTPKPQVVAHLEAAAKGDPLSLAVWGNLLWSYRAANDTQQTLQAFKQLLRVAPTDQMLREQSFQYFLQTGHPDMALDVANEGLQIDPTNAELYDLKSNACLFLKNYKCAVDALETMYATDSTKADTLFFAKISGAAAAGEVPDTTRLLKWAQIGVQKYPGNLTLLQALNRAYVMTDNVDSSLAVTKQLIATGDTTAVLPALAALQMLTRTNRLSESAPFLDFVKQHGTTEQHGVLAQIYVMSAIQQMQADSASGRERDLVAAAELARQAIALVDSTSSMWSYGNLYLGYATLFRAAAMDEQTEKQQSCDMAKQEQALFEEAELALTRGRSAVSESEQPEKIDKYLTNLGQYKTRVASMVKAYCK